MIPSLDKAVAVFKEHGGKLRTSEAMTLGVHPRTLYALVKDGKLERMSRGVYQLASSAPLSEPDLVTVALRVPKGVVCTISALAFHEATTEIPHEVHVALPRHTKRPRLEFPPLRVYYFSGTAMTEGALQKIVDGTSITVFSLPKTVVDCFRLRNKLGLDVAIEALKVAVREKGIAPSDILNVARKLRMNRVILPYLEAVQ